MAKRKKEKLSDEALIAILQQRRSTALNYEDGTLADRRINLLSRYKGDPYGDERSGQSKVTTRQCLEAVEWTLPSLLRVFLASPTIAEFDAESAEDEPRAKQETFAVNRVLRKNDGFMTLFTWIKDTLMNPVAYIKVYWEEKVHTEVENWVGLLSDEAEKLLADPQVEPVEYDIQQMVVQTPMGPLPVELFDIKLKRTTTKGRVVIRPVPPEELTIDSKITSVSLEDADFINHKITTLNRSDLIEMGFDEDKVYSLPTYTEQNTEKTNRQTTSQGESQFSHNEVNDEATEIVEINESYVTLDYDRDGIAEYRKIVWSGEVILDNIDFDMNPFVGMTSVPLPHEHVGESWMELVEDLQKVYTTLTRQLLNNMYRTNNPRPVIGPGVNMADVVNDAVNQPIRARDINQLRMEPTSPVIGNVLPMFQWLNELKETRTGVSKNTMGLDADTLSRVAKGAFFGALEQSNQRLEALARVVAESGIKPLMLKIHKLLKTHQDTEYQLKQGDNWIRIDPTTWQDRDDMTITVGLGTGNKQAQMGVLDKIFASQKMAIDMGKGRIIGEQQIYNTLAKMIELAELHTPEKYVLDPSTMPPPEPPPPDPMIEVQKEFNQVEREKAQLKNQEKMFEIQTKAQEKQQELTRKVAELKMKLRNEDREATLQERELIMKEYEIMIDSELRQAQLDKTNLAKVDQVQTNFEASTNA